MSFRTVPVKAVATLNPETLSEDTDSDRIFSYAEISDVSVGQPVRWQEPSPFGSLPSRARRVVRDGDVIISTVRTYLRAVAHVVDAPATAVVSTGFAVFRPARIDARFLGYALEETHFVNRVVAASVGVSYPAVNASDIARLPISAPSPDIQRQIADYLDHESAEIDAFIADLRSARRLIEERRDSAIDRLVTSGEPRSLRRALSTSVTGPFGTILSASEYISDGVPIVNPVNIRANQMVVDTEVTVSSAKAASLSRYRLHEGDVVLARKGDVAKAALVGRREAGYLCGSDAMVLRPNRDVEPEFLWWQLQSASVRRQLEKWSVGSTVTGLNQDVMANVILRVPSRREQTVIIDDLVRMAAAHDAERSDIDAAIALAKERRAALITAAVTGQIDVTTKGSREHADL